MMVMMVVVVVVVVMMKMAMLQRDLHPHAPVWPLPINQSAPRGSSLPQACLPNTSPTTPRTTTIPFNYLEPVHRLTFYTDYNYSPHNSSELPHHLTYYPSHYPSLPAVLTQRKGNMSNLTSFLPCKICTNPSPETNLKINCICYTSTTASQ